MVNRNLRLYGRSAWLWLSPLALAVCLGLSPAGFAQSGTVHLKVQQTATMSLTLIKPSDPLFDGTIDTYFPGLSDEPGYQTSIRPFLVIVRNDTALTAVAYAITLTMDYEGGSSRRRQAMFVGRPLTGC
jgi:hypothetical protein